MPVRRTSLRLGRDSGARLLGGHQSPCLCSIFPQGQWHHRRLGDSTRKCKKGALPSPSGAMPRAKPSRPSAPVATLLHSASLGEAAALFRAFAGLAGPYYPPTETWCPQRGLWAPIGRPGSGLKTPRLGLHVTAIVWKPRLERIASTNGASNAEGVQSRLARCLLLPGALVRPCRKPSALVSILTMCAFTLAGL